MEALRLGLGYVPGLSSHHSQVDGKLYTLLPPALSLRHNYLTPLLWPLRFEARQHWKPYTYLEIVVLHPKAIVHQCSEKKVFVFKMRNRASLAEGIHRTDVETFGTGAKACRRGYSKWRLENGAYPRGKKARWYLSGRRVEWKEQRIVAVFCWWLHLGLKADHSIPLALSSKSMKDQQLNYRSGFHFW